MSQDWRKITIFAHQYYKKYDTEGFYPILAKVMPS